MSCVPKAIFARWFFDGYEWIPSVRIDVLDGKINKITSCDGRATNFTVDMVVPGLVDSGVFVEGYLESSQLRDPFIPESNFAGLCALAGVTTVVDLGSPPALIAHLQQLYRDAIGPDVIGTGARFCQIPHRRGDVYFLETVEAWISNIRNTPFIASLGSDPQGIVKQSIDVLAGSTTYLQCEASFSENVEVPTLRFSRIDQKTVSSTGRWFAPQFNVIDRWTHNQLMNADSFAHARGFLPYAKHFGSARGNPFAKQASKSAMIEHLGTRDRKSIPKNIDQLAKNALANDVCLVSSGSGWPGVLPGEAVWEEMRTLESMGGTQAALRAATGTPFSMLSPLRRTGCVPGVFADLILVNHANPESTISEIKEGMCAVLIRGKVVAQNSAPSMIDSLTEAKLR